MALWQNLFILNLPAFTKKNGYDRFRGNFAYDKIPTKITRTNRNAWNYPGTTLPYNNLYCYIPRLSPNKTSTHAVEKKNKKQEDERACIILVAFNFYCLQFRYIFFKHVTYLLKYNIYIWNNIYIYISKTTNANACTKKDTYNSAKSLT